jgi:hypothetical protein
MRVRTLLPLVVIALAACTGGAATATSLAPSSTLAGGSSSSGVDPLVPYSPPTTPFEERTNGFVPDTLTAPTDDGGRLYLTPVTTTMTTAYVHDTRALAVYLTIENPGDKAWEGTVGAHAQVTDQNGAVFPAEQPAKGDLHPDPGRYGGANRNLLRPIRVPAGANVKGVLVFHPTGGNRPITLRISVDGGSTWVEWATNLGVF